MRPALIAAAAISFAICSIPSLAKADLARASTVINPDVPTYGNLPCCMKREPPVDEHVEIAAPRRDTIIAAAGLSLTTILLAHYARRRRQAKRDLDLIFRINGINLHVADYQPDEEMEDA